MEDLVVKAMREAVVAENLVKVFYTKERRGLLKSVKKRVEALRGVSFRIREGEVFGLLGPNGAGKTTTIKILSTLLLPDEGEAWVNGFHVVREAERVRESIGVSLYSDRGFYWKLTGRENLRYFAYLYHMDSREAERRIDELLKLVGLEEDADRLVEEYSTGMKSKLNFARALLHDPPILFLDEPTIGLDPTSARRVRELILEMGKQGKTVLLTTHNMFEADMLCDRIAIINRGVIVAVGTPSELKGMVEEANIVEIEAIGICPEALRLLESVEGVKRVSDRIRDPVSGAGEVRVVFEKGVEDLTEILRVLSKARLRVIAVRRAEPTLEDVFVELTGERFEEAEEAS